MNSLTQVRNYVANNFSKVEQDLFDFIVESFQKPLLHRVLQLRLIHRTLLNRLMGS